MKEKIGKYLLLAFIWCLIIGYIVYSGSILRLHHTTQVVGSVDIEVTDSTANGHLVSSRKIREWILHSGISTIGTPINEVNLSGIEQIITKNGFVKRVDTYISYDGVLHIEVHQQRPMMRLLIDGYDTYVTHEGYVFRSPAASALYVPVITGSYRPPFPSNYEGNVRDYVDEKIVESNERIAKIELDKIPLYKKEDNLREKLDSVNSQRLKQGLFQSDDEFEEKVKELRAKKHKKRRQISGALRYNDRQIDAVTARSDAEYRKQKKLEKRYEDFLKLINFVNQIEDDSFWSAEIVQIVAVSSPGGVLELELIPRSGSYTILFGAIENVEQKFAKLLRFYKEGLNNRGWDSYSTINVKYDGQVVCSK